MVQCCHCSTPVSQSTVSCPACGRLLIVNNEYFLLQGIGQGGFGMVYKAVHLHLGYLCAIKQVQFASAEERAQIETEVMILRQKLSGLPFVPVIYGAWQYNTVVYIAMQYIEGATLDPNNTSFWFPDRVKRFLNIMLSHLSELHTRGVIHRDLKPSNIIRTNSRDYVLLDFGIAKQGFATRTVMRGVGTLAYSPPEQLNGDTTNQRSDLYSLGATAYHLLTGQLPPSADRRLAGAILKRPSSLRGDIGSELDATIMALLAIRPESRPHSALEAQQLLNQKVDPPRGIRPRIEPQLPARPPVVAQPPRPVVNDAPLLQRRLGKRRISPAVVVVIFALFLMGALFAQRLDNISRIPFNSVAITKTATVVPSIEPIFGQWSAAMAPDEFLRNYYAEVNERAYSDSFESLSDNFTPKDYGQYTSFWDTIAAVEILYIEVQVQTGNATRVYAQLYYQRNNGTCVVSDTYFDLVFDKTKNKWLIDRSDTVKNSSVNCR